jgi:hypothetical protein
LSGAHRVNDCRLKAKVQKRKARNGMPITTHIDSATARTSVLGTIKHNSAAMLELA